MLRLLRFSLFIYLIHVSLVYAVLPLLTCPILCCFPLPTCFMQPYYYSLILVSSTRCLSPLLLHSSLHAATILILYKLLQ